MTICSLVVYAKPETVPAVSKGITEFDGTEVHVATPEGKLIVSLDHPDRSYCSRVIMDLNNIEGVISTSLVYEYFE